DRLHRLHHPLRDRRRQPRRARREQPLPPPRRAVPIHSLRPPPSATILAVDNVAIARVLEEVADVLEIQDANPFRIRAYRNAVRTVETQTVPLERLVAEGAPLTRLAGIGKEMESHIREMVAAVPRSLLTLMRRPGVGPKKAKRLFDELGVGSVDELEEAAKAGRVA